MVPTAFASRQAPSTLTPVAGDWMQRSAERLREVHGVAGGAGAAAARRLRGTGQLVQGHGCQGKAFLRGRLSISFGMPKAPGDVWYFVPFLLDVVRL